MEMNDYQSAAETFAFPNEGGLMDHINEAAFGLLEEAGEVAGKLKRIYRGDSTVAESLEGLKQELGDCQWYLSQLALRLGFTLDEIAEANLKKLTDRKNRGVIRGEGDKR